MWLKNDDFDIILHPMVHWTIHTGQRIKKKYSKKKSCRRGEKHKLVPGFVMSTNQIHLEAYG